MEELIKFGFLLFCDGGKLDRVDTELLEVAEIQIPSKVDQKEVKSDTLCVKETLIIGTDSDFDAASQQVAGWVGA